jgi:hypothetical protein
MCFFALVSPLDKVAGCEWAVCICILACAAMSRQEDLFRKALGKGNSNTVLKKSGFDAYSV